MENSLYAYPLYSEKINKSAFCQLHPNQICAYVCTEILCPKCGFICKECTKLGIHQVHSFKIAPISKVINYIAQNLEGNNFEKHLQQIQDIQESLSEIILFFKESKIPSCLSLERSLIELKENFWTSILCSNTESLRVKIQEINNKKDHEKIASLISFLDACGLSLSRLFTTDLGWYFDLAIQIIIDEFKRALFPYTDLLLEFKVEKNIGQQSHMILCQNLTKVII